MTTRCTKTDYDTFRQMLASYGFIHCPVKVLGYGTAPLAGVHIVEGEL